MPDLVTLTGKTYKAARVMRVEPDGINYMFAGGMVKVPFEELPEAVRKQYGYDPAKAAAFATADDAAQARAATQASAAERAAALYSQEVDIHRVNDVAAKDAIARKRAEAQITSIAIQKNGIYIRATVHQILKEGVLVSYKKRLGLYNWPEDEEDGLIYVSGLQKKCGEGDTWEGGVFPFGVYQYDSVGAGHKNVRGYALTPYDAAELQSGDR